MKVVSAQLTNRR